jgi:hypothetical protein
VKDCFYEELEHVFDKFPKYHMKILLGDFNAKRAREDIFKQTVGNGSLHEISNDNAVRVVNKFCNIQKSVKSTMFHSHIITFINLLGHLLMERHNQIDHILIDSRRHSSILDVRSFRAADCDTDHTWWWQKFQRDWQ